MKKSPALRIFPIVCLSAALAGCTLHTPNLKPEPLLKAGASYTQPTTATATAGKPWYETFGAPELSALIEAALKDNMSVREAIMRLKQAEALTTGAGAARLPAVSASAEASRQSGSTRGTETEAGLSLSWEIDAFNRLGAALTARTFEEKAAAEDIAALRLSLAAEVAEAWYGAVGEQLKLALLRQQTAVDGELLGLIDQRLEAGIGTEVEVLQQKGQLAENQSLIPPAEAALRTFENRLDVLTGAAPDGIDRTGDKSRYAEIGTLPPLGVPSDLLLNRPDLRALQNRLIADDAEIGAAIADRLPRLTLTGTQVFSGTAGSGASLLAGLVQPVLDWGRRKAEVERNEALYQGQLAAFTQTYLEAVEDVENTLYRENRQREYIERLETRRGILDRTLKAAEAVYRQGESDYMPVLDAVKDLRAVERSLVAERLNLILLRIRLFRAIGAPAIPAKETQ